MLLQELVEVIPGLQEPVDFTDASFPDVADFGSVVFHGKAIFDRVNFEADVRFGNVTFEGDASFVGIVFRGEAAFGATAADLVDSLGWRLGYGAEFHGNVTFGAAEFRGDALFESVLLVGSMTLDRVDFHAECRFDVMDYWLNVGDCVSPPQAPEHKFSLRSARFRDGAEVVLPVGNVDATDIEIGEATRRDAPSCQWVPRPRQHLVPASTGRSRP